MRTSALSKLSRTPPIARSGFFTKKSLTQLLDDLGFSVASLRRESGSLLVVARR